jgi:hypothetical protein
VPHVKQRSGKEHSHESVASSHPSCAGDPAPVGLAFGAPPATHADGPYTIQPILKAGDAAGDVVVPGNYSLWLSGFSDRGQLVIDAFLPGKPDGEIILQYADGKFSTIAVPGGPAPSGTWPQELYTTTWASNPRGTTLFSAVTKGGAWLGLYRWEPDTGKLTQVLKEGMPAGADGQIVGIGSGLCVNNQDEIAVVLKVQDAAGTAGYGIFFIGRDGKWQPVLLPGQELPGGGKARDEAIHPLSCNDAGAVAFLARREGEKQRSAFLWDQSKLTPLLAVGADAPRGKKIDSVGGVWLSSTNRQVIVSAGVDVSGSQGIYRLVDGALTAVAVPGQELPGGGRMGTVPWYTTGSTSVTTGIGPPNQKGQLAFFADSAGKPGLYVMAPDGTVSLVFKDKQVTDLGQIRLFRQRGDTAPPMINARGEIAVVLTISDGPSTVAILTPASP